MRASATRPIISGLVHPGFPHAARSPDCPVRRARRCGAAAGCADRARALAAAEHAIARGQRALGGACALRLGSLAGAADAPRGAVAGGSQGRRADHRGRQSLRVPATAGRGLPRRGRSRPDPGGLRAGRGLARADHRHSRLRLLPHRRGALPARSNWSRSIRISRNWSISATAGKRRRTPRWDTICGCCG